MKYKVNDLVIMKKDHACRTNLWKITRTGVDIKIKCVNCNHEIMMDRLLLIIELLIMELTLEN